MKAKVLLTIIPMEKSIAYSIYLESAVSRWHTEHSCCNTVNHISLWNTKTNVSVKAFHSNSRFSLQTLLLKKSISLFWGKVCKFALKSQMMQFLNLCLWTEYHDWSKLFHVNLKSVYSGVISIKKAAMGSVILHYNLIPKFNSDYLASETRSFMKTFLEIKCYSAMSQLTSFSFPSAKTIW